MRDLIASINQLQKTRIKDFIKERIREFENMRSKPFNEIFKELCFCLMTANCSAEKCLEIHEKINNEFLSLSEHQLSLKLKKFGYRFPKVRASYIIEARNSMEQLESILSGTHDDKLLRKQLVKHIKGLGYKEGSHFLRNIGFKNLAIIDFHIIDVLAKNGLISKPKTLTRKKYLEIEKTLKEIAERMNLTLAELDLYLWYLETNKILK
ncbi:MAG: N-glycosylase/DNA lyase [Promethearchaeota archaeon]